MRTTITTDIHGCFDEFMNLLQMISPQFGESGNDRLVVTGDLVDRGPKSKEVVAFLRGLQNWHGKDRIMVVLGNHDDKYIRFHKHVKRKLEDKDYKIPMKLSEHKQAVYSSLNEDDLRWLALLPTFAWFEAQGSKWLAVHAGLLPSVPVERQDPRVLRHIRYLNPSTPGKMISLSGDGEQPSGTVYWTELLPEELGYKVVYGHAVHSLEQPRVDKGVAYGLDTGCVFGGHLTAMILDDNEKEPKFIQVKANKQYAEPKWRTDDS